MCPLLLKLQGMQKRKPRAVRGNQNKQVEVLLSGSMRKKILPSRSVALAALSVQRDSVMSSVEGGLMLRSLKGAWQNLSG